MNMDSIEHRLMHIEDDIKRIFYRLDHLEQITHSMMKLLVRIEADLTRVVGISIQPGVPEARP